MPLWTRNGKLIVKDGALVAGPCCCSDKCLDSPCEVTVTIKCPTGSTLEEAVEVDAEIKRAVAITATFRSLAGAATSLSFTPAVDDPSPAIVSVMLPESGCPGSALKPYLEIGKEEGSGVFVVGGRIVRAGSLSIVVAPPLDAGTLGGKIYVLPASNVAFEPTVCGTEQETQNVNPNFDSASKNYANDATCTIAISA